MPPTSSLSPWAFLSLGHLVPHTLEASDSQTEEQREAVEKLEM